MEHRGEIGGTGARMRYVRRNRRTFHQDSQKSCRQETSRQTPNRALLNIAMLKSISSASAWTFRKVYSPASSESLKVMHPLRTFEKSARQSPTLPRTKSCKLQSHFTFHKSRIFSSVLIILDETKDAEVDEFTVRLRRSFESQTLLERLVYRHQSRALWSAFVLVSVLGLALIIVFLL